MRFIQRAEPFRCLNVHLNHGELSEHLLQQAANVLFVHFLHVHGDHGNRIILFERLS